MYEGLLPRILDEKGWDELQDQKFLVRLVPGRGTVYASLWESPRSRRRMPIRDLEALPSIIGNQKTPYLARVIEQNERSLRSKPRLAYFLKYRSKKKLQLNYRGLPLRR